MDVPLPVFPQCSLKPLQSTKFNAGEKLCKYIQQKMRVDVPAEFHDNCNALDSLRDQLSSTGELPQGSFENVADYFNLLTVLTRGFDISDSGVALKYSYNNVEFCSIQYEIACMSYNLAIGLLNGCHRYEADGKNPKVYTPMIKAAKALADKAAEAVQDDFSKVISNQMIDDLQGIITAFYYMAQLGVFISMNKPAFFAKGAKLASDYLRKMSPPNEDYYRYYQSAAYLFLAEENYTAKEYGIAESASLHAFKGIPDENSLKKSKAAFKDVWLNLYKKCKPVTDKYVKENRDIFFETVPKELELPTMKPTPVQPGIDWTKVNIPVSSFDGSATTSLNDKIESRLTNFREESSHALADIAKVLSELPANSLEEANKAHDATIAKKDEAYRISCQLSQLLGQKSAIISQRNPQIFSQYTQLTNMFQKASEADVYFETQLATASSRCDMVLQKANKLRDLEARIKNIIEQAEQAAVLARDASNGSVSNTVNAMQTFGTTLDELGNQLNPIFGETLNAVKDARAAAAQSTNEAANELASATNGFGQGLTCYSKLVMSFNNILTAVNQL